MRPGAFRRGGLLSNTRRLQSHRCHGQALAYVYGRETKADADIAHVLTMDEARRIARNIAKLPSLLGKGAN
jgi:hypothetical protein